MKKNAVHKRLDELTEVWLQFTDNVQLRLFRFLVDDDNSDLIEAFLSYHQEEESGLADLFLRFEDPFEQPGSYGRTLNKRLLELYSNEEFKQMMEKGGVASSWQPPISQRRESDYVNFAQCCRSFADYHKADLENLVAILSPSSISSAQDWSSWLYNLVDMTYPANIRFIILDNAQAPLFDQLAKHLNDRVFTYQPEVNLLEILEEIAAEGDPNNPGIQFRQAFIAIGKAAGEKNEKKIQEEATKALNIVDQHQWHPLKVTLYMALGGAYMAMEKGEDCLVSYKKAREAASLSDERGDPEGRQLVLHTAMAEASALVGLERHTEAAVIYDDNAIQVKERPIAEDKASNLRMILENQRMAAYCYSIVKKRELAWERGMSALDTAREMDPETMQNSTLPYVGQGLLELTKKRPYKKKEDWVREQMVELLGEDWEPTN